MKILLDARKIRDGGIGRYIQGVISALKGRNDIDLTLLLSPKEKEYFGVSSLISKASPYSIAELTSLLSGIDENAFDLLHVPHYTVPMKAEIPVVCTVHDLIHLHNPERFWHTFVAKKYIKHALKRATRVIAVSQDTKEKLSELANIRTAPKIVHCRNPVPDFASGGASLSVTPSGYLLLVSSNLKPHKRVDEFLEIYAELSAAKEMPDVVHVGDVKKSFHHGWYKSPGKVSDTDLIALYRHARALIVPSVMEGFCYPMIEAISFGLPVICRPVPAMLELAPYGDCTIAENFSRDAFRKAVLDGVEKYKGVSTHDCLVPAEFSLTKAGDSLVNVYREALEN